MTDYDINDDDRWEQVHRERVRIQTQIDRLTGRVEELENRDDAIIARIDRLAATRGWEAPTPQPAPALDEAARWQELADLIADLTNTWNTDVYADNVVPPVIAKAIALGLAAPADREVCEVTDVLVDRLVNHFVPGTINHYMARSMLDFAAAHWRGAEAGEGK